MLGISSTRASQVESLTSVDHTEGGRQPFRGTGMGVDLARHARGAHRTAERLPHHDGPRQAVPVATDLVTTDLVTTVPVTVVPVTAVRPGEVPG